MGCGTIHEPYLQIKPKEGVELKTLREILTQYSQTIKIDPINPESYVTDLSGNNQLYITTSKSTAETLLGTDAIPVSSQMMTSKWVTERGKKSIPPLLEKFIEDISFYTGPPPSIFANIRDSKK